MFNFLVKEPPMTLMEFSLIPLDQGSSFSAPVAQVLTLVAESGLEYQLTPMGTIVEGEWADLWTLLNRCFRALEKNSDRISLQVKFDYRKGPAGRIRSKVHSVKQKAGRPLKTAVQ
jgi:uncharacterized protein (TIGR00106 family)